MAGTKIVLAPVGTRGDVQPLLGLGVRLAGRGHDVTLCAPANFAGWVQSFGLRFVAIGEDFQANLKDYRDGGTAAILAVARQLPQQFAELERACEGANALIGAGFQFAGPSIAEQLGIPYYYAIYWPQLIPSSIHAMLGVPWQTLPGWLNRFMYKLWPMVWNLYFKKSLNRERHARGLTPIRNVHRYLTFSGYAFLAWDAELGPPPALDSPHTVTGSWRLEEQSALAPELEDFLAAGAAPVYLGFGSMPALDPRRLTDLLVRAAQKAGRRALISAGWAGLRGKRLPPEIRVLGPTPHDLLFPRMAAVVHHGGAGTTAAAARAGVPQIIVPHFGDQFYWGHRVQVCGLGPAPLRRGGLNVNGLAAALDIAVSDPRIQARATSLGQKLRQRDGLAAAVAIIEAGIGSGLATSR
ncbi:MAG: glycosyltransferase [Gemmataceae bacterium]|nr:glycosyltransferase [Gemmataceae bacterium]